jgi:hypothetical protein
MRKWHVGNDEHPPPPPNNSENLCTHFVVKCWHIITLSYRHRIVMPGTPTYLITTHAGENYGSVCMSIVELRENGLRNRMTVKSTLHMCILRLWLLPETVLWSRIGILSLPSPSNSATDVNWPNVGNLGGSIVPSDISQCTCQLCNIKSTAVAVTRTDEERFALAMLDIGFPIQGDRSVMNMHLYRDLP